MNERVEEGEGITYGTYLCFIEEFDGDADCGCHVFVNVGLVLWVADLLAVSD